MTECSAEQLEFHALGRRAVVGRFDGGAISSDGGGLLLSEVEVKTRIVDALLSSSSIITIPSTSNTAFAIFLASGCLRWRSAMRT